MKAKILTAVENIIIAVCSVIAAIWFGCRRAWFKLSRRVLKPYFGIETKVYTKWHDRRAKYIQEQLDLEHNTHLA